MQIFFDQTCNPGKPADDGADCNRQGWGNKKQALKVGRDHQTQRSSEEVYQNLKVTVEQPLTFHIFSY